MLLMFHSLFCCSHCFCLFWGLLFGEFYVGPLFVMQYLVSFLVCNHLDEEESWLLIFNYLPDVLRL